jgi:hypothetical protein
MIEFSCKTRVGTPELAHANARDYRTATGATVEPVPPWIFSGSMMKANS